MTGNILQGCENNYIYKAGGIFIFHIMGLMWPIDLELKAFLPPEIIGLLKQNLSAHSASVLSIP